MHRPIFHLESGPEPYSGPLVLSSADGHIAYLYVLEEELIRLLILPHGRLRSPRTWAIAPGQDDVPLTGRARLDSSGFTCPHFHLEQSASQIKLTTRSIRLTIQLDGLFCRWETQAKGRWRLAAADRPTQSYNFGFWDDRSYHYLQRFRDEQYFGLGERAGEMDRAGQRYRLCNIDAMGYCARTTDPLYKHIPFYITRRRGEPEAFGLFYDTTAECTFDFGRELDNYHGPYRYFVAEHGDLDVYFIAGPAVADVVRRFTWLTGRPIFSPRWSLGYSGSTMAYTDAADAQVRMDEFLQRCAAHDILCDSFHLSSGYTTRAEKRYVFTWDKSKFPDPAAFIARFRQHGVRICANVKPCLLQDHPRFAEAAAAHLLIEDADGSPLLVQFWGGLGAYLDFTSPRTHEFWQHAVTESLLQLGVASTWNDNNEFEIWSPSARLAGFGLPAPAAAHRPLLTLLMLRASYDAQLQAAPQQRPHLISRAGAAGMQRYVQTWSGDNYTGWETLRYNLRMGLGLSLCGVSNFGHDIGGFAGPAPSPELFVRWVQLGIFLPRFSIHSWNSDGTVNEPWMYPQLTPLIAALLRLRYRLLPCLYDLLWRSHRTYEPMTRPTLYDFPEDEPCYRECDEMMLGPNLLVAAVVEPGQKERAVYLPAGCDWYDFFSGRYFAGGQTVVLPAPWEQPVLLHRAGAATPLNIAEQHFAAPADERAFAVFPFRDSGRFTAQCHEDDGESTAYTRGAYGSWDLTVASTPALLELTIERRGQRPPTAARLTLLLPADEVRPVHLCRGTLLADRCIGGCRQLLVGCE